MKKRFRLAAAVVGVAIVGLLIAEVLRLRQPSYHGKTLDEWLDEYNQAGDMSKIGPASEAIRAMGTNSLPFLLVHIKHTDSALKNKLFNIIAQQHWIKHQFYGSVSLGVRSGVERTGFQRRAALPGACENGRGAGNKFLVGFNVPARHRSRVRPDAGKSLSEYESIYQSRSRFHDSDAKGHVRSLVFLGLVSTVSSCKCPANFRPFVRFY